MDPFLTLRSHLLDLLSQLAPRGIQPILAGGFGLYLKREQRVKEVLAGVPTIIELIPESRATQDIDLFLRMEVLLSPSDEQSVVEVLQGLQYTAVTNYFQFAKPVSGFGLRGDVKVDILVRAPREMERIVLRENPPRLGSRSPTPLHGRLVPEAFAVEESPQELQVEGQTTEGHEVTCSVHLPHPFSWLIMKIIAAIDPVDRGEKGKARHSFDTYALVAMMTEPEFRETKHLVQVFSGNEVLRTAVESAKRLFWETDSRGIRAIVSEAAGQHLDLERFHSVLFEILQVD